MVAQVVGWLVFIGVRSLLSGTNADVQTWAQVFAWIIVGLSGVICVFAGIAVAIGEISTGQWLGPIAITCLFVATVAVGMFVLSFLAEHFAPPRALTLLGLRRFPVISFLVVWAVLAAVLDADGGYADARMQRDVQLSGGATIEQRFHRWYSEATRSAVRKDREAVPLVFVAASGGGVRAAYWTALVLDCVFLNEQTCETTDPDEPVASSTPSRGPPFLASGVSGGSLGLVEYQARLDHPDEDWVDNALQADALAPALAWALFVDLPVSLIRKQGGTDRAEILERTWQRAWEADVGTGKETNPLEASFLSNDAEPILVLNGTRVADACRVTTTPLETPSYPVRGEGGAVNDCRSLARYEGPNAPHEPNDLSASKNLRDYLCNDIRRSTAALLSGRFPLISPSGRIEPCPRTRAGRTGEHTMNVVDGGYFDTSAASTISELYSALKHLIDAKNADEDSKTPCVVPVFLQIDNAYIDVTATSFKRPLESTVPIATMLETRNAREAQSRLYAATLFHERRSGPSRYAHIYPRAHPGIQAPLGWTLSDASRRDLRRELTHGANQDELAKVDAWYSTSLECPD